MDAEPARPPLKFCYYHSAMSPSPHFWLILMLGTIAASANLIGGALMLLRRSISDRHMTFGLALSGGFLLTISILNIMPECVHAMPAAGPALIAAGYFFVYIMEQIFAGHAHNTVLAPHGSHPLIGALPCEDDNAQIRPAAAAAATVGLILHSFFDGAAITAAVSTHPEIGWLTFFGVAFHKIPEGFSLAAIVLSCTGNRGRAFRLTVWLGLSSLLGTMTTLAAIPMVVGIEKVVLAVAAGMFFYIAATDLLPATTHVKGLGTLGMTLGGFLTALLVSGILHVVLAG